MARQYDSIPEKLQEFIKAQKIFFVATATNDSRVNLSPKGMDSFRILDKNRVVWLNLTGSGNETAAHLLEHNRITVMFCAFEGNPMILRVFGTAKAYHPRDKEYSELIDMFPKQTGTRQLIDINIEMVQTSCGMAVPYLDFKEERRQLESWADDKGEDGILEYWKEKNIESLDGKPTGIF
ncbi:MAG: putative pyridoxine 5'-phosphate oxidase superfamily flavin-nucleotide-binding protein [Flavobacteriales bacterium]|jgi:predicted pyridoxine 5'-phosphate oxidase superfamily flavin-nucleotide-binding protein